VIAIIDNYDSFTYNLYQAIAAIYPEIRVFRNDKVTLTQLALLPLKGIVISPGPGRPENAGISVELVKALAPSIPILGVCLGHQAIAVAFGGHVVQANEIVHGKSTYIFHYRRHLFNQMPLPFKAGRYHSLHVEKATLPNILSIEAENENGMIMAIKHKNYPCFGIQFHPESILTPEGNQFLNNFINLCQQHNTYQIAAC
jgi:anthranilate synthase/aminodeoxychorismate synthase-like glutamine amidotransferase